jgi:hypothetical protein
MVTLPPGAGATPATRIQVAPGKNQGNLKLMKELIIPIPAGSRFLSKAVGAASGAVEIAFTLGPLGAIPQVPSPKIVVPAKTPYLANNDDVGVINLTAISQEFFLEQGTEVILPAGTVYHIGEEESAYTKPTRVVLM